MPPHPTPIIYLVYILMHYLKKKTKTYDTALNGLLQCILCRSAFQADPEAAVCAKCHSLTAHWGGILTSYYATAERIALVAN